MITLITGLPGSGKTALAVSMLPEFDGRPLFVLGVAELKVKHEVAPPVAEWTEMRPSPEDPELLKAVFLFPPNSVVLIDEAQTIFRPRSMGSKVPPEVQAFETHRHTGIDFILITQHSGLIDPNLRKLISRHIDIRQTFLGRSLYEWVGLGDPESAVSRQIAAKRSYKPPKKVFGLYKSSEKHTKLTVRTPFYVWLFGLLVLGIVGGGWYAYQRIQARMGPPVPVLQSGGTAAAPVSPVAVPVKSTKAYLAEFNPRIEGLAHSAPVYDSVTQPSEAPIPVGCLASEKRCRCLDQQGNDYVTTDAICRGFVAHGMFIPFKRVDSRGTVRSRGGVEPPANPVADSTSG